MLIRYAKLAGSLRLLVSTAAPLLTAAISLLSVRSAAYLVGFGTKLYFVNLGLLLF
jgi:hypothetical protein